MRLVLYILQMAIAEPVTTVPAEMFDLPTAYVISDHSSYEPTPVSIVSNSDQIWKTCRIEQSDICDGYMLATFDWMSKHGEICPATSITAKQGRALLERYRSQHPANRAYSFPQTAEYTLKRFYPCATAPLAK